MESICRNLLFLLFVTRYRFETSHSFSFSYVTALREFPRLLFSATQFLQIMQIVFFLFALKLLHCLVDGRKCKPFWNVKLIYTKNTVIFL